MTQAFWGQMDGTSRSGMGLKPPKPGSFGFGNDHEPDLWPLIGSDGPFWRFRPMAPFGPDSAHGQGRPFGSVELRIRQTLRDGTAGRQIAEIQQQYKRMEGEREGLERRTMLAEE